jgi:hypothetical protein
MFNTRALTQLLQQYPQLLPEKAVQTANAAADWIALYDSVYPQIEAMMWQTSSPLTESNPALATELVQFDDWLACYQALFREQQAIIEHAGQAQYHFVLSIPVADRPAHLRACLESIYQLCRCYEYGGKNADGEYAKITVIVAEDSRQADNIAEHNALVEAYCAKGLRVVHFGQPEQYQLLQAIAEEQRQHLGRLLTEQPAERFYLKGQAANRNLSYLKMLQLAPDKQRTLYYFVDSDQYFWVNRPGHPEAVAALNYFYYINRLFQTHDIHMLTGKLVGDPPVSPAVMAANFLDDVSAFLQQIADYAPQADCQFHAAQPPLSGDAVYHDMANLFGFDKKISHIDYACPLAGKHDNAACLDAFAARLQAFFSGEHLTRKTHFSYSGKFTDLTPARTVYPGNYIVDFAGLKYVIPFGHLRLRMSGPTAGRLIQAEIGAQFASVNLPMQHGRTSGEIQADFRPGVALQSDALIDISNEFERQFFGDLMLFTVEAWVTQQDAREAVDIERLMPIVEHMESTLLALYQAKHEAINRRLSELQHWATQSGHWWRDTTALHNIVHFLRAIEVNFSDDSKAWRQIQSAEHRAARKTQIIDAVMNYRSERAAWDALVSAE